MGMGRALDANNDIILAGNNFKLLSDAEHLANRVAYKWRTYLGECCLDLTIGVDYFGSIFTKPMDLDVTEAELKSQLQEEDEVTTINSFEMEYDPNTRALSVVANFSSIYSEVAIDTTLTL